MDEKENCLRVLKKPVIRSPRDARLWCGKIQSLCDGTLCSSCHLFPPECGGHASLLDEPSLTDHRMIGMIREEE